MSGRHVGHFFTPGKPWFRVLLRSREAECEAFSHNIFEMWYSTNKERRKRKRGSIFFILPTFFTETQKPGWPSAGGSFCHIRLKSICGHRIRRWRTGPDKQVRGTSFQSCGPVVLNSNLWHQIQMGISITWFECIQIIILRSKLQSIRLKCA